MDGNELEIKRRFKAGDMQVSCWALEAGETGGGLFCLPDSQVANAGQLP